MNKITPLIFILWLFCAFSLYAQDTFADYFNSISYVNNDGTLNWTAAWSEIEPYDFNDNPSRGYIAIINNRLDFSYIWNESISRSADLSGVIAATLTFDWQTSSLENNEELSVQVSSDGVSFSTIGTFTGTNTGTFTANITAFASNTTTIRFINTNNNWTDANDVFRVDNIEISVTYPDMPPTIVASGNQNFCPNGSNSIPVVTSVEISDPDDTTLDQITVQISSGYQNGQDVLSLTGTYPNISNSWDATEGRLTLSGPASIAEFESAVLAVVFSSSPPAVSGIREFSIVIGSPLFLPYTGHYYEFVPALDIRWDDARDAAAIRTFFGLQGYLATLTSQEEADFAGGQITGTGWIGASDNFGSGEGQWRWETGPEAGTVFWNGNQTGSPAPGQFAFWNNNEPNNCCGGENYAHITDDGIGVENSWNDLPIAGGSGAYRAQGYIVEYGGMPGDPVLNLSQVTRIRVSCTIISNRRITYRVRPAN